MAAGARGDIFGGSGGGASLVEITVNFGELSPPKMSYK